MIEIKGQQLRIRIKNPKKFSKFRTHDVGSKGKLQRIAAYNKKDGWITQSWRLNLKDYKTLKQVTQTIKLLKISDYKKKVAINKAKKYFKK